LCRRSYVNQHVINHIIHTSPIPLILSASETAAKAAAKRAATEEKENRQALWRGEGEEEGALVVP